MPRDWDIAPPWKGREALASTLRISPVVAQVLHNRGIDDAVTARQFFKPSAVDLIAPELLPGATVAAERIARAIEHKQRVVLFGDYDVDGITGVAILWHCLKLAGLDAQFYIPRRLEEGYGINAEAIETLARDGAQLMITVDCAVTAIEQARRAKELGVDLIITDHHAPRIGGDGKFDLPDALIVHPMLDVAGQARYANPHLSGSGVALKLAWAIAQRVSRSEKVLPEFREFLVDAMGLAALGIIADVVPLLGENRIIASHGLSGLPATRQVGLQALIQSAGLTGKKLDGYDVGFKLAPRLNAIGRMGHALLAVELLTRASQEEAQHIAKVLEGHNRDRQALDRKIAIEAREMVRATGQDDDSVRAIVLASPGWHAGVIGIVASRIVEEFGRPAVLIAIENGLGQGSARSLKCFPLHEALAACGQHLTTHGGHAMAAGLRIESAKIDAFREAFQAYAAKKLGAINLRERMQLDDVVQLAQLDAQLVADLQKLEPYGVGNPSAKLATDWLEVVGEPRTVGNGNQHLQVVLKNGRGQCKGIAFGQAGLKPTLLDHRRCRVAFTPIINEWNGRTTVEMQIADFQFPEK